MVEHFDLKALKKIGFINSITYYEEIETKIVQQFGLSSIFEYSLEVAYPLFSRGKRPAGDKMFEYWVKSAYGKFLEIDNPNKFDKPGISQLIPKIRPYTRDIEYGMLTVIKALYNLGLTVIAQPYLPKTHVFGMTMMVKGKPCIALSNYQVHSSIVYLIYIRSLEEAIPGTDYGNLYARFSPLYKHFPGGDNQGREY